MVRSTRNRFGPAAGAVFLALLMAGSALAQGPLPLPPRLNVESPYVTVATPYAEDFESGDGGFVAGGNETWEHGQPSFHVTPVVGQGPNMWGTDLDGTYIDRLCGWVDSPQIDLAQFPPGVGGGLTTGRLLFRHWMQFENRWDGGVVQASRDGVQWDVLTPVGGYDNSIISSTVRGCLGVESGEPVYTGPTGSALPPGDDWENAEFDVSQYLGGPLFLRWVMATDTSGVRLGWYFDDVRIEVGAGVRASVDIPQPDPVEGVPFTPLTTLYTEDFEADDGGWTTSGTAWEWGEPLAPPTPPTGGINSWGTTLNGAYGTSECSTLTSGVISLPGSNAANPIGSELAHLRFQMWRHTRSGYDGAAMQVSNDGGASWARIVPLEGYDRTIFSSTAADVRDCLSVTTSDAVWSGPFSAPRDDQWENVTVDLTPYLGSDVQVRFVFGSTGVETTHRGVYIDDFVLQMGASAAVDPDNPLSPVSLTQPGWTVNGDASWGYGVSTSGPFSATPVWATDLHGDYGGNECGAIVSPTIDTTLIPGLGRLRMTMEHYFNSYSSSDAGIVQVSKDGGETWTVVQPEGGYGGNIGSSARACLTGGVSSPGYINNPTGSAYEDEAFDLRHYESTQFRVRFVFTSSSSGHDLGWYVRNVAVDRGLASVPLSNEAIGSTVWDTLGAVADDALLSRLKSDPHSEQPAVLLGPAMRSLTEAEFPDRAEAKSHLLARSEPFFVSIDEAAARGGGEVLHRHAAGPSVSVRGDAAFLARLIANGDARAAAYDGDDSVHLVDPIEPEVGAQNTGGRQLIQAEDIWALGYHGEGIKLTIIDTGIDPTHEAFKFANGSSRIVNFTDYVNSRSVAYDDHGHGTHVGATAAGSDDYVDPTHGAFQEKGVAYRAELYGAKFLSSSGSGSLTNGILSLQWAFDQGSDITSNSWGSTSCSGGATIIGVVHDLTDLGMLSVFAAGNNGASGSRTVGSPGCGEAALTIGAVDQGKNIASFSSRGPCSDPHLGTPERICPDVVAKGVDVRSAIPRTSASFADPTGYRVWSGTSMATPHAAGAAALAEQMKREISGAGWDTAARAEEEVFKLTAEDLGAAGPDNSYGWGLIQLLPIHALLESTDEANVIHTFGISKSVLHQGETATLSFSVRNLGAAFANGTFEATLTDPNGDVTVLDQATLALGLLDGHAFSDAFTVTSNVLHGNYTFRGTFTYSWTNSSSGEVFNEVIDVSGVIEVKRVYFDIAIDGYAPSAMPILPQTVTGTATNIGNEDGTDVRFEFTVPDSYLFVPGENFELGNANSQYANPTPDAVIMDSTFGRVTLVWDRPTAAVGETFSFSTQIAPTELGAQRVLLVAKYHDGISSAFSQAKAANQVVEVVV